MITDSKTKRSATLAKLSVCGCGFPLLNESIPIGTEYELDLKRRMCVALICGGCGKTMRGLDAVFVHSRVHGQRDGFLPIEVFEVNHENDD